MKILPNKTFPHPVLRAHADDYINREFQTMRNFSVDENDAPVLSFQFSLTEESIVNLLDRKQAVYALEVYCPATFVRSTFCTHEKDGEFSLKKGDLYRKVEVNAFVVCTEHIKKFSSPNFNKEFGDSSYDLLPGDVVVADEAEFWYWDTESTAPLYSVFQLEPNSSIKNGMFAVDTSNDIIQIQMHPSDRDRFQHMRKSTEQKPMAMFVYFSVVAEVLWQMEEGDEDENKKWYRVMQHQLSEMEKDKTLKS